MTWRILNHTCNHCNKELATSVKQTEPPFYGKITKGMWCPRCSTALAFVYMFDENNDPHIFSEVNEENASLFLPPPKNEGLTARPKSKG